MARKPFEDLKPATRRRIEAFERKIGVPFYDLEGRRMVRVGERLYTSEELRQRARGHREREHITRAENIRAKGGEPTTSSDYAFMAKQRRRIVGDGAKQFTLGRGRRRDGSVVASIETGEQRFARARKAFLALGREERDRIKIAQQGAEERYRHRPQQPRQRARRAGGRVYDYVSGAGSYEPEYSDSGDWYEVFDDLVDDWDDDVAVFMMYR